MAGTYGSDEVKNQFQIPGATLAERNQYYLIVQADGPRKGEITIKRKGGLLGDPTIGTIPLDNAIRIDTTVATPKELEYFTSAAGQKDVKNKAIETAVSGGLSRTDSQQLIRPGTTTTPLLANIPPQEGTGQGSPNDPVQYTPSEFRTGATAGYTNLRYPTSLSDNQDCIKFSIVEYSPRGLGQAVEGSRVVILRNNRPDLQTEGRKILGTITLPIPGGIVDSNGVDWAGDSLDEIKKIFGNVALESMGGGGEAGVEALRQNLAGASGGSAMETRALSGLAAAAIGGNNILQRAYGELGNPNLELLFNAPTLRDFTFNFRFTPRTQKEAQDVRSIIKSFKRAMSVKRSVSSLILRSPHTFAISYVTSNKEHPYLNKFKECALSNCSVNYTPDGTYMTYGFGEDIDSRSMTAYEMQLTFKELEPLFDDEYDKGNNIGF